MYCEQLVKQKLIDASYEFCWQRYRTPFAEVDLCFRDQKGIYHLIEVKSVSSHWDVVISLKQKQRLQRALEFCMESLGESRMHLAMVDKKCNIIFVADFLET